MRIHSYERMLAEFYAARFAPLSDECAARVLIALCFALVVLLAGMAA